jgi:hypothetical protein
MLSFLLLARLSADPAVPLFGEAPYAYGEAEAPRPKRPLTAFGRGGADPLCPDCLAVPPGGSGLDGGGGTWWIYDDPTWDFSADEPRRKHD